MMTKQEIFDKVCNHLLTQNKVSIYGGVCRYRGSDGLKCAIGSLIPDDLYDPDIELKTITTLSVETIKKIGLDGMDLDFLRSLQEVHDCGHVEWWPEQLERIAEAHSLIVPFNPSKDI